MEHRSARANRPRFCTFSNLRPSLSSWFLELRASDSLAKRWCASLLSIVDLGRGTRENLWRWKRRKVIRAERDRRRLIWGRDGWKSPALSVSTGENNPLLSRLNVWNFMDYWFQSLFLIYLADLWSILAYSLWRRGWGSPNQQISVIRASFMLSMLSWCTAKTVEQHCDASLM